MAVRGARWSASIRTALASGNFLKSFERFAMPSPDRISNVVAPSEPAAQESAPSHAPGSPRTDKSVHTVRENGFIAGNGKQNVRVLLVEDHPMFRDQLARVIGEEPDLEICGAADNIRDAMELTRTIKPDLAIVDISLKDGPGGIEFLKDIRAQEIKLPVLVLSMHKESLYAERILQAGGKGYISKSQSADELKRAIRQVLGGDVYLSPEMTANLLKRMVSGVASIGQTGVEALSDRELEIFQLIGRGQSPKEIAASLNLGYSTIETYRARIREKLGVASAAQLYGVAAGWVQDRGV